MNRGVANIIDWNFFFNEKIRLVFPTKHFWTRALFSTDLIHSNALILLLLLLLFYFFFMW